MEILYYNDDVQEFIAELDSRTRLKTVKTIQLLAEYGFRLGMPYSKKIGTRLFELRISAVGEIRIFYTFFMNAIILLHIFMKKTQKIPIYELQTAQKRLSFLLNK